MRKNPNLILLHRRHREGKTDYHLRLSLLKSGQPRLVVRRSLNNFLCQIVKYEEQGDKIVASAISSELKDFGWKFHGGNTPSAYLTGLLCAQRAKKHKVSNAILDIGLYNKTLGNALFSVLKGAVDGGLNVPHSEKALPSKDRIAGKHISEYAEKIGKQDPAKYKKLFSAYIREKADPREMPAAFEEAKKKIIEAKGEKTHHAKKAEHKSEEHTKAEVHHKHEEHKEVKHEHKAEHTEMKEHKEAHRDKPAEHKAENVHHKK